ncbi:UPF0183 protein [Hibiscus syriacus]|uniref:fructose-bisphosphate aldolase n=1 Tax=Hibiscus syriacus TaxID=106335 RepID=A0A6A2WEW3_HIBSY|nr:UPF0183 protein [Hibiscus syriacus]
MGAIVLDLRPGLGIGPFTLGMPICKAFAQIGEEPLKLDIVISFPDHGFHLRFHPWFRGPSTLATFVAVYALFGPTYPGTYARTEGLSFSFPIPSQYSDCCHNGEAELPLEFPDGTTPVTCRVSIYDSSAGKKVGVGSLMDKASAPPLPTGSFYMEELGEGLFFTVGGQHIPFGASPQDVWSELGRPCGIHQNRLTKWVFTLLLILVLGQHFVPIISTIILPVVDTLFDGQTHKVKKFVLHMNYPGHADFSSYIKCNFVILDVNNYKNRITPSTKWEQVKEILGDCGRAAIQTQGYEEWLYCNGDSFPVLTSHLLDYRIFFSAHKDYLFVSLYWKDRCEVPPCCSLWTLRACLLAHADELVKTAKTIASPGRGILAMDEFNATSPGIGQYISGAIHFQDALYQYTIHGKKMVNVLAEQSIILRTVMSIPNGPSVVAVKEAARGFARYATDKGLVPIVEPEILLDADHRIVGLSKVQGLSYSRTGCWLHPQPPPPPNPSSCACNHVSGGQSEVEATLNLNAMNQALNPWNVSVSNARELQNTCLKMWGGRPENVKEAEDALLVREKANSLAQHGKYIGKGESEEAKHGMLVKVYVY